eukprot:6187868-Pleurochrysis_carterae.AAC.2
MATNGTSSGANDAKRGGGQPWRPIKPRGARYLLVLQRWLPGYFACSRWHELKLALFGGKHWSVPARMDVRSSDAFAI